MRAMAGPVSGGQTRILRADRLVDGTGAPPITGAGVVLVDGKIAEVGPLDQLPLLPDSTIEDYPGCTILPGLVDSHVHLTLSASTFPFRDLERESDPRLIVRGLRNARLALLAGVTTVRDLGSRNGVALEIRDAIASGLAAGPLVLASGRPITITNGHLHFMGGVADGLAEVQALIHELIEESVDVIKVMATGGNMTVGSDPFQPAFKPEEVRTIVEAAHAAGIRVTAHARGVAGIAQVVEAGVDSVEHCRMEVPPGVWSFDEGVAREMAARGTTAAPTMAASHRAAQLHARGGEVGLRPGGIPTATRQQNAARLRECGVSVVVGTDAGAALATFDEAAHVEMELLVGAGWTPLDAIRAGTLDAARAIGLAAEIGSVEVGKCADLLIVGGDPSQDVTQVRRVVEVIQGGHTVVADGHVVAEGHRFAPSRRRL